MAIGGLATMIILITITLVTFRFRKRLSLDQPRPGIISNCYCWRKSDGITARNEQRAGEVVPLNAVVTMCENPNYDQAKVYPTGNNGKLFTCNIKLKV